MYMYVYVESRREGGREGERRVYNWLLHHFLPLNSESGAYLGVGTGEGSILVYTTSLQVYM